MAKPAIKSNVKVRQIFDDLETYLAFCVEYGYKFDEAHLYDMRQFAYRQYDKFKVGKPAKNCWIEDRRP